MFSSFLPALRVLVALTILTGAVYPLLVTGVAQGVFHRAANGSLLAAQNGKVMGSSLVGQPFDDPKYFWSRPSATGPMPYNGANSSGSNLGPRNPALAEAVTARVKALRDADPGNVAPVPVDLVTASGSGLDPHISVAAAEYQVPRVARVRGASPDAVRAFVAASTDGRTLGFMGEPRVNVVALNLALDGAGK